MDRPSDQTMLHVEQPRIAPHAGAPWSGIDQPPMADAAAYGRLALLAEAGNTLASSLDYAATAQSVARLPIPSIADFCTVHLLDGDDHEPLVAVAHADWTREPWLHELVSRLPLRRGVLDSPAAKVLEAGQALLIPADQEVVVAELPVDESVKAIVRQLAFKSTIIAPLAARGQILGVLVLAYAESGRRYQPDDLEFVENLARRCATAIDTARRLSTAQHTAERAARLYAVAVALSEAVTPTDVAAVMLQHAGAALGAAGGAVAVLSQAGDELELLDAVGYPEEFLEGYRHMPLAGRVPLADAVRAGAPVLIESRDAAIERYPELAPIHPRIDLHAWANIPMVVADRAVGALEVSFSTPRGFTREERVFLMTLAQQCGQALERARLYEAERQARAAAEAAVEARDQFLAIAAHELKTPLTSLLGYANLLQQRLDKPDMVDERGRRALRVIVDQTSRLNNMISALLDTSRVETGQLRIERRRLDIGMLARRVVEDVQPTLERHEVTFVGPRDALIVDGDELCLEQVLANLIHNAIKYSPAGGPVTVCVEPSDDHIRVAVADRGIGIPSDALPKLFGRFYRAPNVDRQQFDGMGIGLYVIKELVTQHGGRVEVESQEGVGSTFAVLLPLFPTGDLALPDLDS